MSHSIERLIVRQNEWMVGAAMSPSQGRLRTLLQVPRRYRARLIRSMLRIRSAEELTEEPFITMMIVPRSGLTGDDDETFDAQFSNNGFNQLRPLTMVSIGQEEEGTVTNATNTTPSDREIIDWRSRHDAKDTVFTHRGGDPVGWQLLIIVQTLGGGNTFSNIRWAMEVEFELEWLGGPGNPKNLTMDQMIEEQV